MKNTEGAKKSNAAHDESKPFGSPGIDATALPTPFEWYVDQGGQHAYLMLKGNRQVLNTLTEQLDQHGFSHTVTGRSYRPANNGLQYDIFVRVDEKVQKNLDSLRHFLDRVRNKPSQEPSTLSPTVPSPLEVELKQLRVAYAQLQQELQELKNIRLTELSKGNELEALFDAENKRLGETERALKLERDTLKNDMVIMRAQLAAHHEKLVSYEQNEMERSHLPRRLEKDFEKMIKCLLPNLELVRDSVSVLSNELKDFSDAMRQLRLLNEHGIVKAKRVGGAPAWSEIHFSTGESDAGRIYFGERSKGGKIRVLISHKTLQPRDIKYLAKKKSDQ